jgi:hypothetical protein
MPSTEIKTVPLWVVQRRDICRQCKHATRNSQRLDRVTKGLTDKSICMKQKELTPERDCNIAIGTEKPEAHCPLGFWGKLGA